jgi:hypothetical protein
MERDNLDLDILKKRGISFCTSCEKELEDFCFSVEAINLKALKERVEQCKFEGKLDDAFCAKLFIASSYTLESIWPEE